MEGLYALLALVALILFWLLPVLAGRNSPGWGWWRRKKPDTYDPDMLAAQNRAYLLGLLPKKWVDKIWPVEPAVPSEDVDEAQDDQPPSGTSP